MRYDIISSFLMFGVAAIQENDLPRDVMVLPRTPLVSPRAHLVNHQIVAPFSIMEKLDLVAWTEPAMTVRPAPRFHEVFIDFIQEYLPWNRFRQTTLSMYHPWQCWKCNLQDENLTILRQHCWALVKPQHFMWKKKASPSP